MKTLITILTLFTLAFSVNAQIDSVTHFNVATVDVEVADSAGNIAISKHLFNADVVLSVKGYADGSTEIACNTYPVVNQLVTTFKTTPTPERRYDWHTLILTPAYTYETTGVPFNPDGSPFSSVILNSLIYAKDVSSTTSRWYFKSGRLTYSILIYENISTIIAGHQYFGAVIPSK